MHQLKLSHKQIDKYMELCDYYGNKPGLEKENYLVVKEQDAQPLERWYGQGDEYIVIMPDGEHYHHDQYLLSSWSGWLRGFQPRMKMKKKH